MGTCSRKPRIYVSHGTRDAVLRIGACSRRLVPRLHKVGNTIDWPLPRARVARLRIVEVLCQPEAAGDFHL